MKTKLMALKPYVIPALVITTLVVTTGAAFAAPVADSTPTLSIDFTSALSTIFSYASMIFAALVPIAAIGIGFRFGGTLLEWVGRMLGDALRFR